MTATDIKMALAEDVDAVLQDTKLVNEANWCLSSMGKIAASMQLKRGTTYLINFACPSANTRVSSFEAWFL